MERGCARQRLEELCCGVSARELVHEVHQPGCPDSIQQATHHVSELGLDFGQGQVAPGALPLQPLPPTGVDLHDRRVRRQRIVRDEPHPTHEAADPWIVEPAVVILREAEAAYGERVAIAKCRLNFASKIEVGAGLFTIHADVDARRTVTASTSSAAMWVRVASAATALRPWKIPRLHGYRLKKFRCTMK